jgi:VWFA-related protein
MSRMVCAFAMAILLAAGSSAQSTDLSIRWVSPTADTYLSGQVLLRIVFVGEGGGSRVEDVTFFADGKQVCVTPGAKAECSWDAGNEVTSHALRAVARLKAGGRLVSAIRTKAIEYAESVSVDVVLANAVVTDGGRFVKGLTREQFRILDEARERPITSFQATDAPLELVLALDASASMADALPDLKAAASKFVQALRPQDRTTIVAFNDEMFTLARRESSPQSLTAAIERINANGGTALYDVIVRALQLLSREPGKHAIVIFSDGEDRSSQATMEQVQAMVADNDAMLFAVGLGRGASIATLKERLEALAEVSGGRALFAERTSNLSDAFADVVESLTSQYTIGFEPARDGRLHRIEIRLAKGGFRIRARQSYTAPK